MKFLHAVTLFLLFAVVFPTAPPDAAAVTAPSVFHTVTVSAGANGRIYYGADQVTQPLSIPHGKTIALKMVPDEHYRVQSVTVGDVPKGAMKILRVKVAADVTVAATFEKIPYPITITSGKGGTISGEPKTTGTFGEEKTFTITRNEGCYLVDLKLDGQSIKDRVQNDTFAITVTGNHKITATFSNMYTMSASTEAGGTIAPRGKVRVRYGASKTFVAKPAKGYFVADLIVDGTSVYLDPVRPFYTFSPAWDEEGKSRTIVARFEPIRHYSVTASATAGGAIAPAVANLAPDEKQEFTITPAEGYQLQDVRVDGETVGAVTKHTVTMGDRPVAIQAMFAPVVYQITATAGTGGTISPDGAYVAYKSSRTFTITPNAGYRVLEVTVGGVKKGPIESWTFTNVTAADTIDATFIRRHVLTPSAGNGGTISPSEPVTVDEGGSETFTFTPKTGFIVGDVLVDGVSVGARGSLSLTGINAGHTVSVSFIPAPVVAASVEGGTGGTISPSGAVTVPSGGNQAFTITPSAGYRIADLLVDGQSVGAMSSYSLSSVTADHTVVARFVPVHTITATAVDGGAISPAGIVEVTAGGSQAFTISPADGYFVGDVLVDGQSIGPVSSHIFTDVRASRTIAVIFAQAHIVTVTATEGGTVFPTGAVKVPHNGSQVFTITPAVGYAITGVTVDGEPKGAVTSVALSGVTDHHTIHASFTRTYKISASASPIAGGTIEPAGSVTVTAGGNATFTATPLPGYTLAAVEVDGVSKGAVTPYVFNGIDSDHTIVARFAPPATITATAGTGGTITPAGVKTVAAGSSATYVITPQAGYGIAKVLVDGVSVGSVSTYPFTAIAAGSHTIEAQFVEIYGITAQAPVEAAGGTIVPSGTVTVPAGASQTFTITANPGYAIAGLTVDGAEVGGKGTYKFEGVAANHTIRPAFVRVHSLSATAGAGGTISPAGIVPVVAGASQSYTIIPSRGYHVADVRVDGASVGAVTAYTFNAISTDHTIAATFAADPPPVHVITATASAGGSISPAGAVSVPDGETQAFTLTPAVGYHVAGIDVDGVPVGAGTGHTFTNVTGSHTIVARFAADEPTTHTIVASAGANGTISPAGTAVVARGATQTFTITPSAGYHVAAVLVDGVAIGAVTTYTFPSVTGNHSIAATFEANPTAVHTITASAGAGGSISPAGPVLVQEGASQTFVVTPAAGYHIAGVTVDGAAKGTPATWTFSSVTDNHAIAVLFAQDTPSSYAITASADSGGSITPNGVVSVPAGGSGSFTITPADGYRTKTVTVDNVAVGAVTNYTFTAVSAAHTIAATFEPIPPQTWPVTASAEGGGVISPSGVSTVAEGGSITFTITPNSGYHISSVEVGGDSKGTPGTYTISGVTSPQTIVARFAADAPKTRVITSSAGTGGTISPAGNVVVAEGQSQAFTISAQAGYHLTDLVVDGVSLGAVERYTLSSIAADHTIAAVFAQNPPNIFTITASAEGEGSISPAGSIQAVEGTSTEFTIVPRGGYHIVDVTVDGVSAGAVGRYAFTAIGASHTIVARFEVNAPVKHSITATAGIGGSISPQGTVPVTEGSSAIFTITPAAGYRIASVVLDGSDDKGPVTSYTFANVTEPRSIAASFVRVHTVSVSGDAGGSVAPAGDTLVDDGGALTVTVTPAASSRITGIDVDGSPVGAASSYVFENITADHTLQAHFIGVHEITATTSAGGSVSPAGVVSIDEGGSQTFTLTPDSGYFIESLTVDGEPAGPVSSYTFSSVTSAHVIDAKFGPVYTINASATTVGGGEGGTIAPSGSVAVNAGASQTFTIAAAAGFFLRDVAVDGESVGAVSSFTFDSVSGGHSIAASFGKVHTITAAAGANGTISPAGSTAVNDGGAVTYEIFPDEGHAINDVLVDGVSVGAVSSYEFDDVSADHTITAEFRVAYRIRVESTTGGLVSPQNADHIVFAGSSLTFTIVALPGNAIRKVELTRNGYTENLGAVTSYTLSDIQSDATLAVTFTPVFTIEATAGADGTISPAGTQTLFLGGSATYSIIPNAGYGITMVTIDGREYGSIASYTFSNIYRSYAIHAEFGKLWRIHAALADQIQGGGTISPAGDSMVIAGRSAGYTFTPRPGWYVKDVIVDGVSKGALSSYTFENVAENHEILVRFGRIFTVAASAGPGGGISPSGTLVLTAGTSQVFTITPNPGYAIQGVSVTRGATTEQLGPVPSWTLPAITENITVEASFIAIYTIDVTTDGYGTISDSWKKTYVAGSSQTFTIAPAPGNYIVDVTVDGVSVGAVTSYKISDIRKSYTIKATFAPIHTITASTSGGGTVEPSGAVIVHHGDSRTFTFTPPEGKVVNDVIVDGISQGAVNEYTFSNVSADHSIIVEFDLPPWKKATLKLSTAAPPGTPNIGVMSITVTLPEGVSANMNTNYLNLSGGAALPTAAVFGGVYTPGPNGTGGSIEFTVAEAYQGFPVGEFATIVLDIADRKNLFVPGFGIGWSGVYSADIAPLPMVTAVIANTVFE